MMTRFKQLAGRTEGSTAAEFALVLPLLIVMLFGIVDAGRFLWDMNRAEKATQAGARVAIVTEPLSSGLIEADYAGQVIDGAMIQPGGTIPASALGTVLCNSTACTCEAEPCPDPGTVDSATFTNVLVARMKAIMPQIEAENVEVRYSGSGFGSAGSIAAPGGGGGGGPGAPAESMEVSPLVTVSVANLEFVPITTLLLATFPLPDFATTLPAEDASGTFSN